MAGQSDNIIRFPGATSAEVEAAAASWLARTTSGALTLADLAEFEFWRAASPEHDRVYRDLEAIWDGMGPVASERPLYQRMMGSWRRRRQPSPWAARLGQVAAGLVAVVFASQYLTAWRYEYHTAPGEIRTLTLADGTVVHLKGDTAMNGSVSGSGARTVELARGEAYFDVVHDASRPFTVNAGSGVIRDIGTGFSVERIGRGGKVAVEHGIVAVAASGRSDILTPGQQVSFGAYDMGRKELVDPSAISAWRRGLYVAEGKPLGQVLDDIGEYRSRRIIVISRTLAARRVNAVVQFDHIDAWLDALDETQGVSVRHWGPVIIVGDG